VTFSDLAAGDQVFLDSNTFVYHFGPHPLLGPSCNRLIQRIEGQDLLAYTSTHVLSEVAHRLMLVGASALPGWTATKARQRLQSQPAVLRQLSGFRTAVQTILKSRTQILTVAPSLIEAAATISQSVGLLSSDALIVAVMQAEGLSKLASHDADFDRAPAITRYSPA
jgi:predicted nucleic acid-binding protein